MNLKSSRRMLLVSGFASNFHLIGGLLIPFYTIWGKITEGQVFLLQALFMTSLWLFEVPTGFVADRYGRKVSIAIGTLIAGIGFCVYSLKADLRVFAIAEITVALGASLISGADKALIRAVVFADSSVNNAFVPKKYRFQLLTWIVGLIRALFYPKEDDLAEKAATFYRNYRLVKMMALLIATPLGSMIAGKFGLQIPMRLMIIPFVTASILILFVHEPRMIEAPTENHLVNKVHPLAGFRLLRVDKPLTIIALDKAIVQASGVVGLWLYQGLLLDPGFQPTVFGWIHAFAVAIEIVIIAFALKISQIKGGRRRYLYISTWIPGIGFGFGVLAILLKTTVLGLVAGVLMPILVIGFALSREPYFYKIENHGLDEKSRATVLSTIQMFSQAGTVIMYLLVGQGVGQHKVWVFAIMALILIIWRLFVRLPERTNE